jgi:hypothetical protein
VLVREIRRPENERSPGIIEQEQDRSRRLSDHWDAQICHPLMQGPLNMAQIVLISAVLRSASPLTGNGCRSLSALHTAG